MGLEDSVGLERLRSPVLIYLVHRTQWDKYFTYRKWRCDERTELMGAHTTLEGAHIAVAKDFKLHAEARFPRWVPELRKDQMEKRIELDRLAAEELFNYINQFMAEKKMEDKQVDVGWTYHVTQTTLTPLARKRKLNSEMTGDEEIVDEEDERPREKVLMLEDSGIKSNKENSCPSCKPFNTKIVVKRIVVEEGGGSGAPTETRNVFQKILRRFLPVLAFGVEDILTKISWTSYQKSDVNDCSTPEVWASSEFKHQ
ncbi:hypothetical protein R1sor_008369 [Riccia sorocarpa]|uniref:Transposase n=1 Tax=Riccia sorocarpa TaxID=122646 RepID=A0ABD3HTK4_9MARC